MCLWGNFSRYYTRQRREMPSHLMIDTSNSSSLECERHRSPHFEQYWVYWGANGIAPPVGVRVFSWECVVQHKFLSGANIIAMPVVYKVPLERTPSFIETLKMHTGANIIAFPVSDMIGFRSCSIQHNFNFCLCRGPVQNLFTELYKRTWLGLCKD